ncbi:MAG: M20/M25/M40 family metallo-hydrolase [Deltaproteobacteria bacterium]|jgi:acetylornithine deacetylase|nr:M20/M25/M40 family metallo-hydrolase [Deltaproteobacteria bacterium]
MNPALLETVWEKIDKSRLRQTLLDMIDIYSPSGKEEDLQLYIEGRLKRAGFPVARQEVDGERYNLISKIGQGEPMLYLVGHVDTVSAWDLETYSAIEEWGVVRGLGAADMKGGCAAMLETWFALSTLPEVSRPCVGLLFVVGEEESGDGSARFLQDNCPPWVVIGEPTALSPCFSHYGYLEVALTTRGRRIHSSLPELGHNAVESMLRYLLIVGQDTLFDRHASQVVYSIREMSSSRAGFVVPDQCETYIDLHLPPGVTANSIKEVFKSSMTKAHKEIDDLNLEVDFEFSSNGYKLDENSSIMALLEAIYPRLNLPLLPTPFRSHSDGNLFYNAGCNPLILGPGSLETAHTADEQTSLFEVEAAARIYAALCLNGTLR